MTVHVQEKDNHMSKPSTIEPITLRIDPACEFIGVGRSTMYKLIKEKAVDVVRFGRTTTVTVESLKRCAASKIGEAA